MGSTVVTICLFALFSSTVYCKVTTEQAENKVGCAVCHPLDQDRINIHLVPHSHDDVGWLKSFDEYYYGLKVYATTTPIAVKNIITSVVEELQRNKDRRYIQVETAFFYKWWKEQDETMRRAFKNLVDNGHLEIVNGGWSMNDEACTNYQSTIDQFTLGFSFTLLINDPVNCYLIVYIAVYCNFLFFLDDSIIFGSIFPNAGYDAPQGFCWDISCQNDQIVDDNSSIHFNLEDQVSRFTDILDGYAKFYSKDNKNMLVVMGGDFQYQQSAMYFDNMDKLIKGFKNHEKYNLIYSTPSCYMKSVHDDNVNLTLKTDDFFPYSSSNHDFWAGYFTSRTNLKRFERVGNNILQRPKGFYYGFPRCVFRLEEYDLIPSLSKFDFVKIVNETPSAYELVFAARDIKPLGLKMFHIEKQKQELTEPKKVNLGHLTSFQLDDKTNLLSNVTLNGISLALKQNFYYYISSTGMVEKDYSTSGAYVFTPTKDIPEELQNVEVIGSYNGNLVEEVHQKWITNVSDIYQSIRWYKTDNHIELDWLVGNINTKINYTGIEVISRFDVSDFDNQNVFYTDSNGRETIKRIKNQRADYFYNISWEPVSSNYYPVTSKIVIKDQEKHMQMAILTDRSQGGSSLENNQIELMVHRRTIFDDGKGVGEPLSETEFNSDLGMYARGTHYLLIGDTEKINKDGKTTTGQERVLAQKKLRQPWIGLSPTKQTFDELKKSMNLQYSALNEDLPENVNILTLEPWTSGSYLLRFEHILEKNEDPNLSNKSTISIENLLKGINVHTITEMTLGANVPLSELNQTPRYVWNIKDESTQSEISDVSKSVGANEEISLGPMQIRTFIISTKSSTSNGNVALVNLFLALIVLLKLCIL
uniref:alpha-mannosidase n=1 Tax=Diabrotica virgifera virgifera TaxID=50390 RepID=A0A6P7FYF0_DIAVI